MPDELKAPWNSKLAEIRVTDVPARNVEEFMLFVKDYSEEGPRPQSEQRFLKAEVAASAPVRLTHRTQADMMRYLLNYMARETRYSEQARNCQTFAADFFGFVAGKGEGVPTNNPDGLLYFQPYHPVCRVMYRPRPYLFPYDP